MTELTLRATESHFAIQIDHYDVDGKGKNIHEDLTFKAEWLKDSPEETLLYVKKLMTPHMEGGFTQVDGGLSGRMLDTVGPEKESAEYFDTTQAMVKIFKHHQRLYMTSGSKRERVFALLEGTPEDLLKTPIHTERTYPLTKSSPHPFPLSVDTLKKTELFGRIKRPELEAFLEQLAAVEISPEHLEEVASAFINARLEHPVFQRDEWPLIAFMAYFQGLITKNQLCQLQLLDTYLELDSITSTAVGATVLTPEKLAKYNLPEMEIMDLPPLERMLFKVATAPRRKEGDHYLSSFFYSTDFYELFKIKGRLNVISPSLADRKHRSQFPETAIPVNPVFSYSKRMDRWMKIDTRDAHIPCRYLSNPPGAHDVPSASAFDCYCHDVAYHIYLESSNPYREFYRDLADTLLKDNRTENMELALLFLDRDMRMFAIKDFREEQHVEKFADNPAIVFWANLANALIHPKVEYFNQTRLVEAMKKLLREIPYGLEGYQQFKAIFDSLPLSKDFDKIHHFGFTQMIDCVFGLADISTLEPEDPFASSPSPTLELPDLPDFLL
ncbi:MAG: hypothetical protein MRY21_04350 [Simkaniaceae bacterium]|nr:hypothetical protein [Simkaniaceae bacterium]